MLAFGIEEEAPGYEVSSVLKCPCSRRSSDVAQGASQLCVYLEETYGRDGFAVLIDEGGKRHSSMKFWENTC